MKAGKEWLSISDMMSGLMMVFLFISVVFMQQVKTDKEAMVEIANTYADTKSKLNGALHGEFDKDLRKWGADILADNTMRFKNPDVLFTRGSSVIRKNFQMILDDFFPRYLGILNDSRFKNDIIELRIEGHTSSIGATAKSSVQSSYIYNAQLSQERAFSVLSYLFSQPASKQYHDWLIKVFRANGLAFAKRVEVNGAEDFERSRRVEFRVVTNTEERIEQILVRGS